MYFLNRKVQNNPSVSKIPIKYTYLQSKYLRKENTRRKIGNDKRTLSDMEDIKCYKKILCTTVC